MYSFNWVPWRLPTGAVRPPSVVRWSLHGTSAVSQGRSDGLEVCHGRSRAEGKKTWWNCPKITKICRCNKRHLCSAVEAFQTLMLWYLLPARFLLSTALSATRSVRLEVGPEGTVTPKEHMISGSNQITTPSHEVSHGMLAAVSLALGSVVSPVVSLRTEGTFKNDDCLTVTVILTGALGRSFPKAQKEL